MNYGKAAFVVGIMFTIGKYAGEALIGATEGVVKTSFKIGGQRGNKFAKAVCRNMGIAVDNQNVANNHVIGFKAK